MPNPLKGTVLLVSQNLFFLGRVEVQVEPLGFEFRCAKTRPIFLEFYESHHPTLILIDLEGDESIWTDVLQETRSRKSGEIKVVAFGPHEDVAILDRARNLGCDLVLNKGEFNRALPKIIEGMKSTSD